MADVREERRLGPVEFGQLLGTLLLGLVAARAAHPRGDVPGHELDEAAVAVVEPAIPVQPGHQEPDWRAALLQQRHHERLSGRLAPGAGRQIQCVAVELDQFGFALRGPCSTGHTEGPPPGEGLRRRRMPGRDSTDPGQPRVAVVVEQIGQREGQVVRVSGELVGGEVQHLALGAHHARVGTQVPQRRHPALTDHPVGVLADHAEHADDGASSSRNGL